MAPSGSKLKLLVIPLPQGPQDPQDPQDGTSTSGSKGNEVGSPREMVVSPT